LPPEFEGGPFRLSAKMTNAKGRVVFEILENEWRIRTDNWDAEQKGQRIRIRNGSRDIALAIRDEPPKRIVIERLKMQWKAAKIEVKEGSKPVAVFESGAFFETPDATIAGADIGVDVLESGIRIAPRGGSVCLGPETTLKSGPDPETAYHIYELVSKTSKHSKS
jgi:hypothetical protein